MIGEKPVSIPDRQTMLRHQEKGFRELLSHVWENSVFYRDYYSSHGIREKDLPDLSVQDLPCVTKQTLMDHFDLAVTDPRVRKDMLESWIRSQSHFGQVFYKDFVLQVTSGSSGTVGLFVYDRISLRVINTAMANRLPRPENASGRTRVACYMRQAVGLMPASVYEAVFMELSSRTEHGLAKLNAFQPHRIIGFSSNVTVLAEFALQNKLRIHPQTVVVTGDHLTEGMERKIHDAWGVPIIVLYSCCESLYLAVKRADQHEMEVVGDLNILEVLDDDHQPTPPGQPGRAVLSNLYNKTLPILRYEMGDYLVPGTVAANSSILTVRSIMGRANDALPVVLEDGTPAAIHPIVLSGFFVPGLSRVQFVSLGLDDVRIDYISTQNVDDAVGRAFRSILEAVGGARTRFEVRRVGKIDNDPETGKFRLVRFPKTDSSHVYAMKLRGDIIGPAQARETLPVSSASCILQLIEAQAECQPRAVAIAAPDRLPLSYGRLKSHVNEVAEKLASLEIGRNERVAMVLPQGPELALALISVSSCAVSAPLNPAYTASEVDRFLDDLNPAALLVQSGVETPARAVAAKHGIPVIELRPQLEAEAGIFDISGNPAANGPTFELPDGRDIALVLYTSGTTSRPKRVSLTHAKISASALNIRAALQLAEEDRCLNVMPLFHIHGIVGGLFASLAAGASVVATPGFYAPKFFQWMDAFQPTWYTAVPTMHQAVVARATVNGGIIARNPLRFIRSSSAPMPVRLLTELEGVFGTPVIESYGMTEACHMITSNPLPPVPRKIRSVGISGGPEVAIRGAQGDFVSVGARGEIVIRGATVIQSYDQETETQPDGFADGWLRTGDEGYLDSDGYLFITGRLKELINRGGEKIAPLEVEDILMMHPAVEQAVAFGIPHVDLGEEVAAAVVLRSQAKVAEKDLQEFTTARLAGFKVPRRILIIDEIPKGNTGKIDRSGLANQLDVWTSGAPGPLNEAGYVAPRGPVEQLLAKVWSEVLGVDRVGIHDDFFGLGGDSILATVIISRMREVGNQELSLVDFFFTPTIADLSSQAMLQQTPPDVRPSPAARGENLPLSFAQQGIFLREQLAAGDLSYNSYLALRITGQLDVMALEQSLQEIVRRHGSLRTIFKASDGEAQQIVVPAEAARMTVPLRVVDLRSLTNADRNAVAVELAREEAGCPFDLTRGPVVRFTLMQPSHDDYVLFVCVHHITSDGWSMAVLERELSALYTAFVSGKSSPLPELPIQYTDFVALEQEWLNGDSLAEHLAYWKHRLAGAPFDLALPTDYPRSLLASHKGSRQALTLSSGLSEGLRSLSRQEGVTLFMTLLAAVNVLLHRHSGETDIVLGSTIAGRNRPGFETLIGFLVNTLVLRTDVSENPAFLTLLKRVKEVCLGAYSHQDLPFERLVEELHVGRHRTATGLLRMLIDMHNIPRGRDGMTGLKTENLSLPLQTSWFDLALFIRDEKQEGIRLSLFYRTDLFSAVRIVGMLQQLEHVLSQIVTDPAQPINRYSLVPSKSRALLPDPCLPLDNTWEGAVHTLFARHARHAPDHVAVLDPRVSWTYRELDVLSNHLATRLLAGGIGRGDIVAVYGHRSASLIWALMGILKAGASFCVLDPAYPPTRLLDYLKLAQPRGWLRLEAAGEPPEELESLLRSCRCRLTLPRAEAAQDSGLLTGCSGDDPGSNVGPDDLAYLTFTSGSTGNPKGVMGQHGSLTHFLPWMTQTYRFETSDRFSLLSGLSYNQLQREVFTSLCLGATLVIPDPEDLGSFSRLYQWMTDHKISIAHLTPALGQLLRGSPQPTLLSALRCVFFGGDLLRSTDVETIRQIAPRATVVNHYTSSETQRAVGYYIVPREPHQTHKKEILPLGRGTKDVQLLVLNSVGQLTGIGELGEIFVRSFHIARGYLGDDVLSRERFICNPFTNDPEDRLYRTGELGRYLPDGMVEFVARAEKRASIRGFRVELGEVESVLSQHSAVTHAVVRAQEAPERLVAYVVPNTTPGPSVSELNAFIRERLPAYMIPSVFVIVEAIPLTPNGKVDWQVLPEPGVERPGPEETFAAPETPFQKNLVDMWAELLKVERVGIHDDFFELGGHSLVAAQVISRVRQTFNVELPLRRFFENPTVAELATAILQSWAEQTDGDELARALEDIEGL